MQSTPQPHPRPRFHFIATVLAAAIMAGCGGGSVSEESSWSAPEPGAFDLRASARTLFTTASSYEAHSVSGGAAPQRLRLDIQPSERQVSVNSTEPLFEPESVGWTTSTWQQGSAESGWTSRSQFMLRYGPGASAQAYERTTGLIGIESGLVDGFPFRGGWVRLLGSVKAGGSLGDYDEFLLSDTTLYDRESGQTPVAQARYNVRVVPTTADTLPTQAWLCFDHIYFELGRAASEAYSTRSYCWLIGNDGQPTGPFKATLREQSGERQFEGRRL